MARGWESKGVESQQDEAERGRASAAQRLTPVERERAARRRQLELQRTRIRSELQAAANPRFRAQLEAALKHLDGELKKLG